jgi:hypothetical protein
MLDSIRILIGESKTQKALEELTTFLRDKDKDMYDACFLQLSRLTTVKNEWMLKVVSTDEYHQELNRLNHSLLQMVQESERQFKVENNIKIPFIEGAFQRTSTFSYDVFLSFSSKEKDAAFEIFELLTKEGIKTFFSGETLKKYSGQSFTDIITDALKNSQHFILISSFNAMSSNWVDLEWKTFFEQFYIKDKQNRHLFILKGHDFHDVELPIILKNIQYSRHINEIIAVLSKSLKTSIQIPSIEYDIFDEMKRAKAEAARLAEIEAQEIKAAKIKAEKIAKEKADKALWEASLIRVEEEKRKKIDIAWAETKKLNTETGYKNFIMRYGDSVHCTAAKEILTTIKLKTQDAADWFSACQKNTIDAYKDYSRKNSKGAYLKLAVQKVAMLQVELEWKKLEREKNSQAIRGFLQNNPTTSYKDAALALLNRLDEDKWREAVNMDTTNYYKYYINEFPNGTHVPDASKIISERLVSHDIKNAEDLFESGDYVGAAKLFTKYYNSALMNAENLAKLGWIYERGEAGEIDYARAVAAYRKAQFKGNIRVLTDLGLLYESGLGVRKDLNMAFKFFQESADKGEIEGIYHLARMFELGIGVKQDKSKSLELYTIAANVGHIDAQNKLLSLKAKLK